MCMTSAVHIQWTLSIDNLKLEMITCQLLLQKLNHLTLSYVNLFLSEEARQNRRSICIFIYYTMVEQLLFGSGLFNFLQHLFIMRSLFAMFCSVTFGLIWKIFVCASFSHRR